MTHRALASLILALSLLSVLAPLSAQAPPPANGAVVRTLMSPSPTNDGLSVSLSGKFKGRVFASVNGSDGVTNGTTILSIDTQGEALRFTSGLPAWPVGSDFSASGELFVACFGSNVVCRVDDDGEVTVHASGIPGPAGIKVDDDGNVYVTSWGSHSLRRIAPDGSKHVVAAGQNIAGPSGLARDPSSNTLFVANWGDGRITRVTTEGAQQLLTTLVAPQGTGVASLEWADGTLYATLWGAHQIAAVDPDTGAQHTLAGTGEPGERDGPGEHARLLHPTGLTYDPREHRLLFTQDSLAAVTGGGTGALRSVILPQRDDDADAVAQDAPPAKAASAAARDGDAGGDPERDAEQDPERDADDRAEPPRNSATLRAEAARAFQEERWQQAAELYQQLVATASSRAEDWLWLARALAALGQLEDALSAARQASTLEPTQGLGH